MKKIKSPNEGLDKVPNSKKCITYTLNVVQECWNP